MSEPGWTLDELVAHAAAVLADGHAGQHSRRVREVPDRRAVRWYTTLGLLDRPALRGRTGWYGRRHLLQLVAIKRLQATGMPLARIQAELAGVTDHRLREIAAIPEDRLDAAPRPAGASTHARGRFWAETPAREPEAARHSRQDGGAPMGGTADQVGVRYAVDLAPGISLLLDAPAGAAPASEDLSAVRAAARPLLAELARRGLARAVPEGDTP